MSVFSYITFGTIISGLSAGTVHDLQRRKYAGIFSLQRSTFIMHLIGDSIWI